MAAMRSQTADIQEEYLSDRRGARVWQFVALMVFLVFAVWSIDVLKIPIERVLGMFGPLGRMVSERLMPPDLAYVAQPKILRSIVETIGMSVMGSLIGILITMPLAWFAAWNVSPARYILYPLARVIIVITRGVPTLMWAMLLVAIFGFGPLAGTLALMKATIGFAGKLMAEQIEAIDMERVDAIRATGANEVFVFFYGVLPQVWASWVGIIIYNWDAQFRGSTILGFVGAGGLGLYLREQISVLEYHTAMGVITAIIVLVIMSETLSHYLRHRLY
jgi:phosphonate transport system permease protein